MFVGRLSGSQPDRLEITYLSHSGKAWAFRASSSRSCFDFRTSARFCFEVVDALRHLSPGV